MGGGDETYVASALCVALRPAADADLAAAGASAEAEPPTGEPAGAPRPPARLLVPGGRLALRRRPFRDDCLDDEPEDRDPADRDVDLDEPDEDADDGE